MDWPEVWEALEGSATAPSGPRYLNKRATATKSEVVGHRDQLVRFLAEIEGDMTVAELREALDEYL